MALKAKVKCAYVRGNLYRSLRPTWSNRLCYLATCADLCHDVQLRQVPWTHVGTKQSRPMTTRWVLSSRYLSRFRRARPGNTWSPLCLEKPEPKHLLSVEHQRYILHNKEFGASASNPRGSTMLSLHATSSPCGVKTTPQACKKATPFSSVSKSSSRRTNGSDIVGR